MSSPTIKDVAKLAGVSISTVSRVMNNSKPVSPESRRKVEDAIKKLDFKRNELARSLVMKRSNFIGVVVKDIGINYMAQIVRGVEEIGRMYKYDILLASTYGDFEQEQNIVDFLFRKQADAILLVTEHVSPEVLVKLKNSDTPYLQLDKYHQGEFNTVTIDYQTAAEDMTKFLVNQGHEKILFLYDIENRLVEECKLEGYEKTMIDKGLNYLFVRAAKNGIRAGYEAGEKVISEMRDKGITAVFASSDFLAIGLINYCLENGIKVPKDLSIVGFGNTNIAADYTPSITTVSEPYYDIGAVAMRRLIKELKDEEKIRDTVFLPTQIIQRESNKKI